MTNRKCFTETYLYSTIVALDGSTLVCMIFHFPDNGDNDDEDQRVFTLNGLDIDLDEFEAYEQRIKAKQQNMANVNNNSTQQSKSTEENFVTATNQTMDTIHEIKKDEDDLDILLENLKLKEEHKAKLLNNTNNNNIQVDTLNSGDNSLKQSKNDETRYKTIASSNNSSSADYTLALYWFMAILHLSNLLQSHRKMYFIR